MNDLLAFNIEPGWATAAFALGSLVVGVFFKFYGDARWQRKIDADVAADAAKQTLDREVKTLQAVDTEVKKAIADLTETVKAQDTAARGEMTTLRGEMSKGFTEVGAALAAGILSLTKEVAIIQGRLAGASGAAKSE